MQPISHLDARTLGGLNSQLIARRAHVQQCERHLEGRVAQLDAILCGGRHDLRGRPVVSMSQARSGSAVVALDGCGDDTGILSAVEKHKPAFDRWSAAPSMTVPRYMLKLMAFNVEEN